MARADTTCSIVRGKTLDVKFVGRDHIYTYGTGHDASYSNGMTIEGRNGGRHRDRLRVPAGESDPTLWVDNLIAELMVFRNGLIASHSKD